MATASGSSGVVSCSKSSFVHDETLSEIDDKIQTDSDICTTQQNLLALTHYLIWSPYPSYENYMQVPPPYPLHVPVYCR